MPIYKDSKIILVHIVKTGGTALDQMLSPERSSAGSKLTSAKVKARHLLGLPVIGKHSCGLDYKNYLKLEYENYYKIAFVRNPWDWLVSWYAFVTKTEISPDTGKKWRHALFPIIADMNFDQFIEWVTEQDGFKHLPARKMSAFKNKLPVLQKDWIVDESGKNIVDFVGRFERLGEDIDMALSDYGFKGSDLKVINKTHRDSYRGYYKERTKKMVSKYFREDIEDFGYDF